MSVGVTMNELLAWLDESASHWKAHLEANPALLELPCSIGNAGTVQGFVRHIWGVELRWSHRLAGLPELSKEEMPSGPLESLYAMHQQAMEVFSGLLAAPEESWNEGFELEFPWAPGEKQTLSRRKVLAHALFHSQRHWAQLATLVREAGFPSKFWGDLLLSSVL